MKHLAKQLNTIVGLLRKDLETLYDIPTPHEVDDTLNNMRESLRLLDLVADLVGDFENLHDDVQKNLYSHMEGLVNNLVILKKAVMGPQTKPTPEPTLRYSDSFPNEPLE